MRLLLPQDLRARGIPYSSWQLRRLEAAGKFPRRVLLIPGGQRVAWREHEINDWIESREPRAKVAKPREASRRECARPDCDAEFEVPQRERGGRPPKYCRSTQPARRQQQPRQRVARGSWRARSVDEVRQSSEATAVLAQRYGVSAQAIRDIRRRARR